QEIAEGTQTKTITDLSNDTEYTFTARAVDKAGNVSGGKTLTLTPGVDTTPPEEVTQCSSTLGNAKVGFAWTDPIDDDFDHVEITWTPGGDTPQTTPGGAGNAVVTGLANETAYTFTVKTVDKAGNKSPGRTTIALTPSFMYGWTVLPNTSAFGSTININDIIYANDKFVAVGASGRIAHSADGETWTTVTNSGFGTTAINRVAWGNGKFVAVGATAKMAYSSDGVTWTAIAAASTTFASSAINGIAWGGGKFVAVGAAAKMAYSSDGETWTAVGDSQFGTTIINSVAWGGSAGSEKFVAVGGGAIATPDGKIAYSSDGENWTLVTSSPFGDALVNRVAWCHDRFIAGTYSTGQLASSSDGENWTLITVSGLSSIINDIAWGGPSGAEKFISAGAMMAHSSDGENWTAVSVSDAGLNAVRGIVWAQDKFTAVGASGKIAWMTP
ncbi:MAG: fibronectin type III domain-containing protein, partial [Spirochaetaceae bacterium]|nr:fibronectin type III domain-containing protein [Spirochaetaceae bacterium]